MTDYGTDVALNSLGTGIDPYFSLASGPRCVAEAIARRLQTPLGGLLTDWTYGYDLRSLILASVDSADLKSAEGLVEEQCLLDERVDSCDVSVSLSSGVLIVIVRPELVGGESFSMTFNISSDNTSLVYAGIEWPDGSVS